MELLAGGAGLGYLLKSRVTDVAEFIETVGRITAGAFGGGPVPGAGASRRARRRRDPLGCPVAAGARGSSRPGMAEGASNAGIARRIYVTEGTVVRSTSGVHLDQASTHRRGDTEHWRVLAVSRSSKPC